MNTLDFSLTFSLPSELSYNFSIKQGIRRQLKLDHIIKPTPDVQIFVKNEYFGAAKSENKTSFNIGSWFFRSP